VRKLILAGAAAAAVMISLTACDEIGGEGMVDAYCRYGAVSRAQLEGCIGHVTEAEVRRLQTHASQYAFGDLDRCLADAGPICTPRD
jgi:hypothetical protein